MAHYWLFCVTLVEYKGKGYLQGVHDTLHNVMQCIMSYTAGSSPGWRWSADDVDWRRNAGEAPGAQCYTLQHAIQTQILYPLKILLFSTTDHSWQNYEQVGVDRR